MANSNNMYGANLKGYKVQVFVDDDVVLLATIK